MSTPTPEQGLPGTKDVPLVKFIPTNAIQLMARMGASSPKMQDAINRIYIIMVLEEVGV